MIDDPAPTAVSLEGVSKRLGDHQAVHPLDLHVAAGEFLTLLGPSGCGKTTILRLVAGFLRPDEGSIRFDGVRVDRLPPWERQVGMVFQSLALWPHLSVFDNVAFGLRQRGMRGAEVQDRVDRALAMVGLAAAAQRRPSQISGGQQQRVALARTLVVRPRVLLLDEPLSALDAELRVQLRSELARLQSELGLTTVYVTHDQEEALSLSGRVAVFAAGRLLQVGTPQQVYRWPASPVVASFVGGANLVTGTVLRVEGGQAEVEAAGLGRHRVALAGWDGAIGLGARVAIGLRPDAIRLAEPASGQGNRVEGHIVSSLYFGARVQYLVAAEGGARLRVDVPVRDHRQLAAGERVELEYLPSEAVLLPADVPQP